MPEFDSTIEYRDVPDFPGYKAGSDGSVWSCWVKIGLGRMNGSKSVMGESWKQLTAAVDSRGRLVVTLCPARRTRKVHQLILEAFVGQRPAGMQCRHFPDRDQTNCQLNNLQWGTPKENQADRQYHGTDCRGVHNPNAKLTEEDVLAIRSSKGVCQRVLAAMYGVSQGVISRIKIGSAWNHVKPRDA